MSKEKIEKAWGSVRTYGYARYIYESMSTRVDYKAKEIFGVTGQLSSTDKKVLTLMIHNNLINRVGAGRNTRYEKVSK